MLFSHKFIFAKFSRKQKDLGDFHKYENAVVKLSPEKGRIFDAKVYIAYDLFSWKLYSVQWLAILNKLILGRGSGDNWNRLRLGYLSGKKDFKPFYFHQRSIVTWSTVSTKYLYVKSIPQYMSPRWNWDSLNPSLASECASPPHFAYSVTVSDSERLVRILIKIISALTKFKHFFWSSDVHYA